MPSTWRREGDSVARKALVVSPEIPYPMHGGGPLRTVSLIEYLRRGYQVDLIVFREDAPIGYPADHFHDVLEIPLRYHSRHPAARLWRNASRLLRQVPPLVDRFSGYGTFFAEWLRGREYEIAVLEHLWIAPYAGLVRPHARRMVLDLHNIESVYLRRLKLPFARAARAIERRWLPRFDAVLTPSEVDAAQVRAVVPGPLGIYPNAVPFDVGKAPPIRALGNEEKVLAMSGNFDFPPNREGLTWFLRRVWPLLRRARPDFRLRLIGRGSDRIRRPEGVEATGPVTEAVPEIARASVAIVPLLSGSGTRLKILEAWAAGVPVVSTTIGAEGLTVRDGEHLAIADSPEEFSSQVLLLAGNGEIRRRFAAAGRQLLQSRYTWNAAWRSLDENRVMEGGSAASALY